jgi:predicted DNA-binding ribbon-helix-helix protein
MGRTEVLAGVRMMRFRSVFDRCEASALSKLEAAALLGVDERTFRRWCRRYREEGDAVLAAILDRAIAEIDGRIDRADRVLDSAASRLRDQAVVRYLTIDGKRRKLTLERDFWLALDQLADRGMTTVGDLCQRAAELEGRRSIISALRVYVVRCYAPQLQGGRNRAPWQRAPASREKH